MIITNKAIKFLQDKKAEQEQHKQAVIKEKAVREFKTNEQGFYTMQQCYIIQSMIDRGALIESNGLLSYTKKDGTNSQYKIANITAYNMSCEYYNQLRELGIKNCVELLEWGDTIKVVQKVSGDYMITTITENGINSEPYHRATALLQFKTIKEAI